MDRLRIAWWASWGACAAAIAAAAVTLAAPLGGPNRLTGVIPVFAAVAVLVAVGARMQRRGWLGAIAFGAAALALIYAMLAVLLLPLRLAITGTCPDAAAYCPVGFEHPATSGENIAVYVSLILGIVALILISVAAEMRFIRKSGPR